MNYKLKIALFLLVFSNVLSVWAQVSYVHYTTKDGLPQMQCMSLMQDSKGYLWISTKGGISRFDGINFKNYSYAQGLPVGYADKIIEDSKGNIRVITREGIGMVLRDTVILYKNPFQYGLLGNGIRSIIDKHDTIWITAGYGSVTTEIVTFCNGIYNRIELPLTPSGEYRGVLAYDQKADNVVLTLTNKAGNKAFAFSLKNKTNADDLLNELNKKGIDPKNETPYLPQTIDGEIFIYKHYFKTKKSLLYQIKYGKPILFYESNNSITKFLNIDSTYALVKEVHGANCYLFSYNKKNKKKKLISELKTHSFLYDSEKNIWLNSENGLYKLTPFHNYDTINSNTPYYVWSVFEDKNNKVWFTNFPNEPAAYFYENKLEKGIKLNKNVNQVYYGAIQNSKKENLIPTGRGIIVYDGEKFHLKELPGMFLSILEDTLNQAMYYGTNRGLCIEKNSKTKYDSTYTRGNKGNIVCLRQNKKGEIWFASRKYIGTLNKRENIEFKIEDFGLHEGVILHFDYKQNLWIGAANGLFLYAQNKFIKLSHPDLNQMVNSIAAISPKEFVYGGRLGIGIFNLEAFYKKYPNLSKLENNTIDAISFVNYFSESSGFLGEEVGQNGIFCDSEGRVWVPTNTNVVMFRPEEIKENIFPPKIYINSFDVSTNNIDWIRVADTISEISYKTPNIHFSFIGISLSAPKQVKYKYRLVGFSDKWSKITKNPDVNYTNLPPGNYRFEVLSCNSNGVWNNKTLSREFEIIPAFRQTFVFKILLWFIGTALVVFFILFVKRKREKRELARQKLLDLQYKAARSQLYPHFLFNTVSAIGSFIYNQNYKLSYTYFVRLSELIRTVLNDSKKGYKSLESELIFVENYLKLQKLRFQKRFNYSIHIAENIDIDIQIPQMMVQTYVENAVKHGLEPLKEGGLLQVNISRENEILFIVIEDNGIGLEESKKRNTEGTKSGLVLMNEIYNLHNDTYNSKINWKLIDLTQHKKKGVRIELSINQN